MRFAVHFFLLASAVLSAAQVNITTFHNDNQRTGLNSQESTLTLGNVNTANFGKVGFLAADGKVDAQPLYVSNVTINGASHNVVYVVSEHDTIYAFDAADGTVLWQTSALLQGEVPSDDIGCGSLTPEIGISATPVIDLTKGTMYFVAMSKTGTGTYYHRLHAVSISTGAEMPGSPVELRAPGLDPKQVFVRAALVESKGSIYMAFASHCDYLPYNGWVMQYSPSANLRNLGRLLVLNLTPNGSAGAIWASGGGMAADANGSVYLLDGNGTFDTTLDEKGFPLDRDFGNAALKLGSDGSSLGPQLKVLDYFATFNTVQQSDKDKDFGSGGALVVEVPAEGGLRHLVVGAGKDTNIYVLDRTNMGKWNPNNNANAYQVVTGASLYGCWCSPAYFNDTVYYGGVADKVKGWQFNMGRLSSQPVTQTVHIFAYPGVTPSISSNGPANGILWIMQTALTRTDPGTLHAFNALDLSQELYNSDQNPSRDRFGAANKFATPMIADGRVYVGVNNGVVVFGLLQSR